VSATVARHQRATIVLATFLGTWLLGSVYAFASPVGTSPDEPDHWRYAYAVYTGQDASDGWLEVPVSLTGFPSNCIAQQPDLNASCVPRLTEDREIVGAPTALIGAPILYYTLIGWPLTQWPDERGILISRVLSALVSALLWAIAILPWAGTCHWPARLAVILTAAPAALYFSGTIQSSGMEIASFAALWSLSLVVFGHLREASYRTLPRWIQVTWPLLMVASIFIRVATGWFVAILLLVAWIWSAVPPGRLLRDRRLVVAAVAVAGAATVRFVSLMGDRSAGIFGAGNPPPPPEVTMYARVVSAAARLVDEPDRGIGLMGWIDTQVPSMGTMYWFLMAGGIAFLAAPYLRRRHLVALGALFVVLGTTWILLDVSVSTITNIPFWQARYGFPIWMGVPLLLAAATVVGMIGARTSFAPVLRWGCALGLVVMHVFSVAYLMVRYMYGTYWFGPVGVPGWTPYAQTTVVADHPLARGPASWPAAAHGGSGALRCQRDRGRRGSRLRPHQL
jgi:hypothetical protein